MVDAAGVVDAAFLVGLLALWRSDLLAADAAGTVEDAGATVEAVDGLLPLCRPDLLLLLGAFTLLLVGALLLDLLVVG